MLKELPDWTKEETKARLAEAEAALNKNLKNKSPATVAWVARQLDYLSGEVVEHLMDLRKAVADLEAKTALLEESATKYRGVHDKAAQYNPGDCATFRGGLWHCNVSTKSLPGTNGDWRLMHKTPAAKGTRQPWQEGAK
jgi:hypothetical protein